MKEREERNLTFRGYRVPRSSRCPRDCFRSVLGLEGGRWSPEARLTVCGCPPTHGDRGEGGGGNLENESQAFVALRLSPGEGIGPRGVIKLSGQQRWEKQEEEEEGSTKRLPEDPRGLCACAWREEESTNTDSHLYPEDVLLDIDHCGHGAGL